MRELKRRVKALETDIKRKKIAVRSEQVMALYGQVCLCSSYQINVRKLTTPIELIDLAWILAICSLRTYRFKNTALIALKMNIYRRLIFLVNGLSLKNDLKKSVVNEVELHNTNSCQEISSYILPSEVVILLLSGEPDFLSLCINTERERSCKESKGAKEKKPDHCISNDELPKNNSSTASDNNRPSAKASVKCEYIVRELEDIAMTFDMDINREILWIKLIEKLVETSNDKPRFILRGNGNKCVIEKATGHQWDRDSLKYHMNRVVKWHRC